LPSCVRSGLARSRPGRFIAEAAASAPRIDLERFQANLDAAVDQSQRR